MSQAESQADFPPPPAGDEWLDQVDDNDRVIAPMLRSATQVVGFRNFRVINAFIRNERGEIWVPRRAATKRQFPLCLDCSVGGHVGSGESYDTAFFRETAEEVGLDLTVVPWRLLGALNPHQHNLSAFMQVYEVTSNVVPPFNPNDFVEWFWMTPQALLAKLRAGEPAKGDLAGLIRHFYG